jgi:hypothetical protein
VGIYTVSWYSDRQIRVGPSMTFSPRRLPKVRPFRRADDRGPQERQPFCPADPTAPDMPRAAGGWPIAAVTDLKLVLIGASADSLHGPDRVQVGFTGPRRRPQRKDNPIG